MYTSDNSGPKFALGVCYNGTAFSGWETQPGRRTVQQNLEQVLSRIAAAAVKVCCAGRTDTGVHAAGQVVHFTTVAARPERALVYGANALLPQDVSVQWARPVATDFHARFSAISRRYRYLLLNRRSRCALYANRCGWEPRPLCLDSMCSAASALTGRHDFSSFQAAGCQARHPIRNVYNLEIARHGDMVVFDIAADAFLQRMVRNIVGTLIKVGLGQRPPSWVAEVLAKRDRTAAGPAIAAAGLYLLEVCYPERYGIPVYQPQLHQF